MPNWPLVSAESLVQEVDGLKPQWGGRWSLELYQKAFDEVGLLRPVYRVVLPQEFAYFLAARNHLECDVKVDERTTAAYEEVWGALQDWRFGTLDPETRDYFENPPTSIARAVRRGTPDETVDWSDWDVPVAKHQGRDVTEPIAYSFYGSWHRLRFWALLEAYTFRGLIDPHQRTPAQVFAEGWDGSLKGHIMTWTVGDPRVLRVIADLERNDWLPSLYFHREMDHWAQLRAYEPRLAKWAEGQGMSPGDRAAFETDRLRVRTRAVAEKWAEDKPAFLIQMGRLLELWSQAQRIKASSLGELILDDLWAAVRWAGFLYGDDLDAIDRAVQRGPLVDAGVRDILQPEWSRATSKVKRQLPGLLERFNQEIPIVALAGADATAFLSFLEGHELAAWCLELSGLLHELEDPTDASIDRRFLHLKSLSTLVEPILVVLVDERGTPADRARMNRGNTKDPLKVFLADRQADSRAHVWQLVEQSWQLTQTGDPASFEQSLNSIANGNWDPNLNTAARMLLSLAALRNFGSHRFTRDRALLARYQGQLLQAVVWTPVFYWKVATTLG